MTILCRTDFAWRRKGMDTGGTGFMLESVGGSKAREPISAEDCTAKAAELLWLGRRMGARRWEPLLAWISLEESLARSSWRWWNPGVGKSLILVSSALDTEFIFFTIYNFISSSELHFSVPDLSLMEWETLTWKVNGVERPLAVDVGHGTKNACEKPNLCALSS